MNREDGLYGRWIVAVTLGELVGFLAPTLVGVAGAFLIGEVSTAAGAVATLVLTAVGGLGEGAVLAFAESVVLKKYLPELNRNRFIIYTAGAAALAWVIGMTPSTLGNAVSARIWLWIIFGTIGVPFFLVSIGGAQWLELRRHVKKAWLWIVANAIAWPLGAMLPTITIMLVPDRSPVWAFAAAGLMGGVLMGAFVGAVTGVFLIRLLRKTPI
jgi:hypothetical protein